MPSHTISERRKRGLPTRSKARRILKDGTARGRALSKKQKGAFGVIVGGEKRGT